MPVRYLLVYDAECGPCSRFKSVVRLLDAKRTLGFASLGEADEAGALAAVEAPMRYRSFHLVSSDGGTVSGAEALMPLVGALVPRGERLTRALQVAPGFRRAVTFAYTTLSRLHETGSCRAAGR